jgi:hypothetical protein
MRAQLLVASEIARASPDRNHNYYVFSFQGSNLERKSSTLSGEFNPTPSAFSVEIYQAWLKLKS